MKKLNPADLSFSIFLLYLVSISVRDVQQVQIQVTTEATKKLNPADLSFSASCCTWYLYLMYTAVHNTSKNRSNEKAKSCGFIIFSFLFLLVWWMLYVVEWGIHTTPCTTQVRTEATKSSNLRFDHFLLLVLLGWWTSVYKGHPSQPSVALNDLVHWAGVCRRRIRGTSSHGQQRRSSLWLDASLLSVRLGSSSLPFY